MEACKYGHTIGRYKGGTCKQCAKESRKTYRATSVKSKADRVKETRAWRDRYPEKALKWRRQKMGLPEPTHEPVGFCEACGVTDPGTARKTWRLDHCHETGVFRGWLCNACNTGIGMLGDNVFELEKRLAYLRRFEYGSKVSRMAEDSPL